MAAIITSRFRVQNANNFVSNIADDSVYVGIGKSDAWSDDLATLADSSAPTPVDALVEENDFWTNLIAMKKVAASDAITLTRRVNWESGETYVAWDDADEDIFTKDFYIITDEFKVYKCINAGAGASTVKPTQTNAAPTAEGDGYVWKYMYSVAAVYQKFLTTSYIPVKTVASNPGSGAADEGQWTVQTNSASSEGKVYRIIVTAGGSGYSSTPTVNIYGDGAGAVATATVSANAVTAITLSNNGTSPYNNIYVEITGGGGGSGATARAVLSPKGGHGTDARQELGGYYVGVAVSLEGIEAGDFIVDNYFRQVGIVKDPYDFGTTDVATDETLSALKELTLSSHSGFIEGDYITGDNSGAIGYIDSYDAATGIIKYHQNDKTGYTDFEAEESITGDTAGSGDIATASAGGLGDPEVEPFSGHVLFVENRAPISRSASQIEDVKIIIEF